MTRLFAHKVLQRLFPKPVIVTATKMQQLCPAEQIADKPALFDEGNLAAIIDPIPGSSMDLEMRRLRGQPCDHFATISYELRDVRIDGEYLASGWRYRKYPTNRPSDDRTDHGVLDEAYLSANSLSGKEFGHWLRDALVGEIHGQTLGLPAIGLARKPWLHEPGYRAIAQLPCLYPYRARIKRLVMLDDRGLNTHWMHRFHALRERMRAGSLSLDGASAGPLVFVDRGSGARMRDPANLEALKAALDELGFRAITPTDMTPGDIAIALRDAKLAVSVEGSHLNHLHSFAPDGLTLITLQDPRRFSAHHKRVVDLYGTRFGIVVGTPVESPAGGYGIDPDLLRRVIDLA